MTTGGKQAAIVFSHSIPWQCTVLATGHHNIYDNNKTMNMTVDDMMNDDTIRVITKHNDLVHHAYSSIHLRASPALGVVLRGRGLAWVSQDIMRGQHRIKLGNTR